MSKETISVTVNLIDYEYRFACLPLERDDLLEAARCLDEKMRDIRQQGGNRQSLDAIAVMAALNLSYELLLQQRQSAQSDTMIRRQMGDLMRKLDGAFSTMPPTRI